MNVKRSTVEACFTKRIGQSNEKNPIYYRPEGGFEKEEIEHLASKGAKVVSLGKRILRAETAAIVVEEFWFMNSE